MPRIGQIIPEYLVPHVQTYINDNTQFVEEVPEASDSSIRFLCLFASDKGEPWTVKKMTHVNDFLAEYGTPNFDKYGQPNLMPYAMLSSGNASCWCMRVTDEKAANSNFYITATHTTDAEGKFAVTFGKGTFAELKTDGKVSLDTKMQEAVESSENVNNILFAVSAIGSGVYGDSFRIRILLDVVSSRYAQYPMYTLEVLDVSTGTAVVAERFTVSFNPNSNTNSQLRFVDDVVNDPENGSSLIRIYTNVAVFNTLLTEYVKVFDAVEGDSEAVDTSAITLQTVDFLTGKNLGNFTVVSSMDKYTIDAASYSIAGIESGDVTSAEVTPFSTVGGVSLAGGSDGDFGSTDKAVRDAAITTAYKKALNKSSKVVPALFSKRRTPAEFILDANYPCSVKAGLVELALHRYDAQCILDAGLNIDTVAKAIAYATNKSSVDESVEGYGQFNDIIVSKECQHYKTRDPFTQKIIDVTYTYFLAQALPTHFTVYGNHIPFVGAQFSTLTGHIRNSLVPEIDADDLKQKEEFYNLKVNFAEAIGENTYIHALQGTTNPISSDLSEMNNVAVMLDMKRQLEDYVNNVLYNFSDVSDRQRFTETANKMFEGYVNNKVREYSIYFDMNEYEAERNILHCYLAVTFRQLSKRGIIEIDINKRS